MIDYENLKEYLSIILDMEKNVYIQDKTLKIMKSKLKTYGLKKEFASPIHREADSDNEIHILKAGAAFAVIGYIIDIIINWKRFQDSSGVFGLLPSLLHAILPGLGIGIVGGLIFGLIIGSKKKKELQAELDEEYQKELKQYRQLISADKERLNRENKIREDILSSIGELESKYKESYSLLEEFYQYGILANQYRHDIVAISSFYQYLCEKRTYCLEYDRENGDRGAYNIYNEELQRGMIISKLDVVVKKLDQIIENQRTLQYTMQEANKKISYLSNSVNRQGKQIKAAIEEQTAIQAYNAERVQSELSFMNTMHLIEQINRR